MLKDKYSFKLPVHELRLLADEFDSAYNHYSDYSVVSWILMLTVLKPIRIKINSKLLFPKKITTITFNQQEAVAFAAAYDQCIIRFNMATSKIATEINKTLI